MSIRPFVVLMAEDNQYDILATRRAWKQNNIHNPLYIVRDWEECLDFLYHRGDYGDPEEAPRPGIVLLDIKMPKMDGLGVLEQIRRTQPIVISPLSF